MVSGGGSMRDVDDGTDADGSVSVVAVGLTKEESGSRRWPLASILIALRGGSSTSIASRSLGGEVGGSRGDEEPASLRSVGPARADSAISTICLFCASPTLSAWFHGEWKTEIEQITHPITM